MPGRAGGGLAGRGDLAPRVPAARPVPPQGAHHQLGLLPRVRRGGHVRPEDPGHLRSSGTGSTARRPRPWPAWPSSTASGSPTPTSTASASTPPSTWATEALRAFCDVIREFAQSIGKEQLPPGRGDRRRPRARLGGGGEDRAWTRPWGSRTSRASWSGWSPGYADPADYFSLFRNWVLEEPAGHRWYRNQVVTLVDDHDQVRKGGAKWRFCGDGRFRDLAFNVMAVQLTTMGIPCIYYGSEQGFDSGGRPERLGPGPPREHVRRPVRRAVHAGPPLLQRGRRPVPRPGRPDRPAQEAAAAAAGPAGPAPRSPGTASTSACRTAWATGCARWCPGRACFVDQEVLVALNTDEGQPVTAYSTVAPTFRVEGDQFHRIFWYAPKPAAPPPPSLTVERTAAGCWPSG